MRNSEGFTNLGEGAFAPDFHGDDVGKFFRQLLQALFKLVACFVVRVVAFKPWMERFVLVALGVGGTNGEEIAMSNTPTPGPASAATTALSAATTVSETATSPAATATATATTETVVAATAPSATSMPAQVVVARAFRATLLWANHAAEFPALGLANAGSGEWVVVVADVTNASDGEAPFRMTAFSLETADPTADALPLDDSTGSVATALGLDPAFDGGTALRFAAGETYRVALVFFVPATADGAQLRFAEQVIGLDIPFAQAADPFIAAPPAEDPTVIPATIVRVIDATTLAVDIDGVASTVRIAGITAPLASACYGSEAAQRTGALLAGRVVLLEDSGVSADGLPVHDIWLIDPEAKQAPSLVAATLASEGAVIPDAVLSTGSYAAWITGSASDADANDRGLWSACGA